MIEAQGCVMTLSSASIHQPCLTLTHDDTQYAKPPLTAPWLQGVGSHKSLVLR